MQDKLNEFNLTDVYTKLNSILDIENSDLCILNNICDLTTGENNISVNVGQEPTIFGPFKVGYEVVDGLLMAYYDGVSMSKIGWGQIQPEDWPVLMEMTKADQKLRFGCPEVAKHMAKPLLGYIDYIFKVSQINVSVLVGDDSNIMSILASLGVKPYNLEDQPEMSPIGGKVIFEKWYNGVDYYLKIKYVYLSTEQIRNGARISEDNPVRETNLELQDAIVNEQGHCTFAQFMKIVENVLLNVPT
ncbi:uncharacterized protein LOC113232133 [Hyposmocoma kahamanoa]|uniref:uncharacterized protein LOC113232133 n=1 Tax=Hyposmocoma kahamanoa TaxID=1477025 RepID=UPI000E6D624A|nr:uncharacterized protein LOC113232133 [Hyposmocoma kahamanoa]